MVRVCPIDCLDTWLNDEPNSFWRRVFEASLHKRCEWEVPSPHIRWIKRYCASLPGWPAGLLHHQPCGGASIEKIAEHLNKKQQAAANGPP